jgi:hypothetical protein
MIFFFSYNVFSFPIVILHMQCWRRTERFHIHLLFGLAGTFSSVLCRFVLNISKQLSQNFHLSVFFFNNYIGTFIVFPDSNNKPMMSMAFRQHLGERSLGFPFLNNLTFTIYLIPCLFSLNPLPFPFHFSS